MDSLPFYCKAFETGNTESFPRMFEQICIIHIRYYSGAGGWKKPVVDGYLTRGFHKTS